MSRIILGIESSCDDTSAAVIKDGFLLSNVMASQEVHRKYGGVIPELASRAHQQNILPVVHQALKEAEVEMSQVDAIAFTRGPGLLGSLLVGTSFAKGLSLATGKPLDINRQTTCGGEPSPGTYPVTLYPGAWQRETPPFIPVSGTPRIGRTFADSQSGRLSKV